MEKVAIIIPVFNSSKYLKECLDSVIAQTYHELEIILVNDGSSDNSLDIIEEYAVTDSRIKYKSIDNSGVSVARNTGLGMAKSDYIIFVDSDDVIESTLVETLIRENDADFVMCGYEVNDTQNNRRYQYICSPFKGEISDFCNVIIDFLIPPFLLGPCFKLFKKEIIMKSGISFPIDISYGEDAEFVLSYLEHVKSVRCINYVGYSYRQYDAGTLSKKFRKDKMDIYKRINDHIVDLIKKNKAGNSIVPVYERYIQNFVEYSHELFAAQLPLSEKKKLFFSKAEINHVLAEAEYTEHRSIAQKMLLMAVKHKSFLPVYIIFTVRDRLIKRMA